MTPIAESTLEEATLEWLNALGYALAFGPLIAPGESAAERDNFTQAYLPIRLRSMLARLNPSLPAEALDDAFRKVTRLGLPSLVGNNRVFHRFLVDGVPIEYSKDGRIVGGLAQLLDCDHPTHNDWLAVNQFTVTDGQYNRRPDVVIFVNGLPLGVLELKNPADESTDIWKAFNQFQTYKQQIPDLFTYNEALVISDGVDSRIGSLTADKERFNPWRTITGDGDAPRGMLTLEVLLRGVFEPARFLELIRYCTVFEGEKDEQPVKKMAGYHQFHAVRQAVDATLSASRASGDRRAGVIWHTQGSGKSLTMAFYAGRIILHPAMENPTIVVITDRNDLDDQLFGTFSRCHELLRQAPIQAESREDLKKLLRVASGGVVFTTIQKFVPPVGADGFTEALSDRRNIVVIADEAHRSQYDFIDGYARAMRDALPNASFIGFTGTPIEKADANTRAVFGDYISIYDIQRAVADGATVPIYYESRLTKLALDEKERPALDPGFEEVTEGEEQEQKERLKTKWAALEAVVGAEKRVRLIAQDIVAHFERRQEILQGKAMIVCMSRRICFDLYNALVALRPEWHDSDDKKGAIKIVMTGSASDPLPWQEHIRSKKRRENLANRFKNPSDPFKVVIVRDMWLTGFDAPSLHTMYVDKPMYGHGLMQSIARVNRVFKDKPGGLVVDYIGLANPLREALAAYTESGGTGQTAIDQAEAVAVLKEKYEIVCGLFHQFDWKAWVVGSASQRVTLLPVAQDHILSQQDGKTRFLQSVTEISQAFALAVPHEYTTEIRDDVAFFQAVRAALAKTSRSERPPIEDIDRAIQQLISRAVASDQVVDIFSAAGLKKPDISILSSEFLEEVRNLPHHNLAVELLQKLLNDEIRNRSRKYLVQSRSFAEMLERTIRAYQNRALETAQVIEELIALAKDMRAADQRGENLGLNDDELAFYDALEVNDSAVQVLGDETLKIIAHELVEKVRANVTIDWTVRESVRAKLRTIVKRILRRHGYPPDKQEKATQTVLEQAELIAKDWAG